MEAHSYHVSLSSFRSESGTGGGSVVVTLSLIVILWLYYKRLDSNSRLPPGPRGLPLVGNLLSLDPELHSYFAGLARTYGPIYKLRLGSKLCFVVSSSSLAREVLKDQDATFANRDVPAAGKASTYGGKNIVWSQYGPQWRMLRKVSALKMLSNTMVDSVHELRRKQVRRTMRSIYGWVGSEVNVGEQMFVNVLNVITSMLWGGTVHDEASGLEVEFRRLISVGMEILVKPNVSDLYPGLARFDLQGVAKQTEGLAKKFDSIFESVIKQRMRMDKEGGATEESEDFVAFLLRFKQEEQDSKTPFTMTHLKALLMDMVVGGTFSSSNTIEFALAELMNKPEALQKVQQELDHVVGRNSVVEESHLDKLPYLCAVMKETLRLHPGLPLMVPHCPSETTTVGGYTVPKGTGVFINVWAIHRDPSSWENPLEFEPTRFFDSNLDFSGSDFKYFPFGSGRRICPGVAMGETMVMHPLATLLHSFDWKLPQGMKLDLSEKFGMVMKKKIPLIAIPTPRLSDPALYE